MLSWRWLPLTILSKNLLKVISFHWSRNCGSIPTCTTNDDDGDKVVQCNTSRMPLHTVSFLHRLSWTTTSMTRWFPASLTTLKSGFKAMFLCWRWAPRIWYRLLLNIKLETHLGFTTCHRGTRLSQAIEGLLLNLQQIPVDFSIKANLTGSNSILNGVQKGEIQYSYLMILLEGRIKKKG